MGAEILGWGLGTQHTPALPNVDQQRGAGSHKLAALPSLLPAGISHHPSAHACLEPGH